MEEDQTTNRTSRAKLAGVLGAAALAIPGGALVSNALADSGSSGSTQAPAQQQLAPTQDANPYAPAQGERPDGNGRGPGGRDCPEEEGNGGGSGSGSGSGSTAPDTSSGTAYAPQEL
jgi:hypothetical protein